MPDANDTLHAVVRRRMQVAVFKIKYQIGVQRGTMMDGNVLIGVDGFHLLPRVFGVAVSHAGAFGDLFALTESFGIGKADGFIQAGHLVSEIQGVIKLVDAGGQRRLAWLLSTTELLWHLLHKAKLSAL